MPKISITHDSKLNAKEAYGQIKDFFQNDADIRKFDSKVNFEFADSALSGKAQGSQFKADFSVTAEGAGSKINLVVDLPLILTPLKGKVQALISSKISKYLS